MKEIIKKIGIGVLVVLVLGTAVYKIAFKSDEPPTDPFGSGVTDGGQVVTDVNGSQLSGVINNEVSGTTQGVQSSNPAQVQQTTASGDSQGTATTNNGGYVNVTPTQGQQSQGGNSNTPTKAPSQNQGEYIDDSTSSGNKIDAYQNIFKSGKFMMKINDPDLGPVTMAMNGNKMYIDASMEGLSLKMIYDGDKRDEDNPELGTWYIVLDSLKKYSPLPADMIGDMNVEELTKDFAKGDNNTVYTASVEDVNGELLECESCVDSNGNTTKYYFRGDELVRSDSISPDGSVSTTEFQMVTGDVPDSVFQIPSDYSKWNISWLINMLG